MTTVYVVQGEHPEVPGVLLTVHASLAGANAKAAELTNMIAAYMNPDIEETDVHEATADDWAGVIENCQDYFGAQYCYVELLTREVQS